MQLNLYQIGFAVGVVSSIAVLAMVGFWFWSGDGRSPLWPDADKETRIGEYKAATGRTGPVRKVCVELRHDGHSGMSDGGRLFLRLSDRECRFVNFRGAKETIELPASVLSILILPQCSQCAMEIVRLEERQNNTTRLVLTPRPGITLGGLVYPAAGELDAVRLTLTMGLGGTGDAVPEGPSWSKVWTESENHPTPQGVSLVQRSFPGEAALVLFNEEAASMHAIAKSVFSTDGRQAYFFHNIPEGIAVRIEASSGSKTLTRMFYTRGGQLDVGDLVIK